MTRFIRLMFAFGVIGGLLSSAAYALYHHDYAAAGYWLAFSFYCMYGNQP